jgi:hypothetical protein
MVARHVNLGEMLTNIDKSSEWKNVILRKLSNMATVRNINEISYLSDKFKAVQLRTSGSYTQKLIARLHN